MTEEEKDETLQWAVDFMERFEKSEANKRRIERIKQEDNGY